MEYLLGKMRVNNHEAALLVSEPNSNHLDKERVVEMVFEDLGVPAFFTLKKSILSLFSNGRSTGLVLETGANLTQIVPIAEGYILHKSMISTPIGGDTLTRSILTSIEEKRGREMLPHFCYRYSFDAEGNKQAIENPLVGNVDPSVLLFHKMRYAQEMKELLFKVSAPSDEK